VSDGFTVTLVVIFAVLGVPILMIGVVWLISLQLRAEHDPDSLVDESTGGVRTRVAIGGAVLAWIGGFCVHLAFVGELRLIWLFVAAAFLVPVFKIFRGPKPKPGPPVTDDDDIPWKKAIPRIVAVLALGALFGAMSAGAISTNEFFVGVGVYMVVLALLNRWKPR
jgi:hypothetical protein